MLLLLLCRVAAAAAAAVVTVDVFVVVAAAAATNRRALIIFHFERRCADSQAIYNLHLLLKLCYKINPYPANVENVVRS